MASPTHASKYITALTRPFDMEAEGAQVPDQWSFPTSTNFVRANFTLSTGPTVTNGNVDFVVQPNVLCTVACAANGSMGPGNSQIDGPNLWSVNNAVNGGFGFNEYGLGTEASLSSQFERYRVVGWGVRVRALQAPLNQQGKLLFAKVPSLNQWANYQTTQGGSSWNDYLQYYGLPGTDSTNFITTSINALPSVHETSVATISVEGGLDVPGQICAPLAYGFRDGGNTANMGVGSNGRAIAQGIVQGVQTGGLNPSIVVPTGDSLSIGVGTYTPADGTQIQDVDFLLQGGWSVLVCRGTGLTTTPGTPVFDIEVIFHLEGLQPVGAGTGSFGQSGQAPPVHMGLLNAAHSVAARMPAFQRVLHQVRDRAHHVNRGLTAVSHTLGYRDTGHMMGSLAAMSGLLI